MEELLELKTDFMTNEELMQTVLDVLLLLKNKHVTYYEAVSILDTAKDKLDTLARL